MNSTARHATPRRLEWVICRDILAGTGWLSLTSLEDEDAPVLYEHVPFVPDSRRSIQQAVLVALALTEEYLDAGYTVSEAVSLKEAMLET